MSDQQIARLVNDWPGKSFPKEHPALWHMLDVGAVACRLLDLRPICGSAEDLVLAFFVTLHDLGKISSSFRALLRKGRPQNWRHWEHSAAILRSHDALLADILGGTESVRQVFYEAAAGHHGGPRERPTASYRKQQMQDIGKAALTDAAQAIRILADLFPILSLDGVDDETAIQLSWHLNGLVVQSDWIGSNPEWFPAADPEIPVPAYWLRAKELAKKAVSETGIGAAVPVRTHLPRFLPLGGRPRPMQTEVQSCALPDGPVLGVIEDSTGAGKTEAALILASRMMQANKADGLFFALPTMATANAMLPRLEAVAQDLFVGAPTLGLSHGRARLSSRFRKIKGDGSANPESGPHCTSWLADDRRRILLSDIGVGTIDQALFAVLPTRFNALRLRALSRKVLIVDEAHSYDPYMEAQLKRLLSFQARLGGSAIVLTATLPNRMKTGFVTSFQQGLAPPRPSRGTRRSKPAEPPAEPSPYPALTISGLTEELTAVNPATSTVRRVEVSRVPDTSQAEGLIVEASGRGAACIWIRNAVDDAIDAVELLREAKIDSDLLHARFAVCDRLEKERKLQDRFGKEGRGRSGRVLVATQVAEQSLDLDFDFMVSDLAPIGSLIQRAGRLWRHMDIRPAATRPVLHPVPILHVVSPDPSHVENNQWLKQVLCKGAYVYPTTVTWRSAKAVFDAGELRAPEGLRDLIEKVEGTDPLELPEALENDEFKYTGQHLVEKQLAENCLIKVNRPFDQEAMRKVWDDEQFPTRLGVPQVTLVLARTGGAGLEPYAGPMFDGQALSELERWAMSEVQVSKMRLEKRTPPDQDDPEIQRVKQGWSEARAKYTLIAPLGPGGQICEGLRYDPKLGLRIGAN